MIPAETKTTPLVDETGKAPGRKPNDGRYPQPLVENQKSASPVAAQERLKERLGYYARPKA